MPNLSWSPLAETDLEEIYARIAFRDGRRQTAKNVVRGLRQECEDYARLFAKGYVLGTARPDLGESLRVFTHKRWVVVFRPVRDGIEVVRVIDGSRDFGRLFGG